MPRLSRILLTLIAGPLVGALITPAAGMAQDWRPEWGDRSIAFALPFGGGSGLGLWWHRSGGRARALELGLDAGAALDVGGEFDRYAVQTTASLGLASKRYGTAVGPVSPHLYSGTGVRGRWQNQGVDDPNQGTYSSWGVGAYGRVGLGVDWFPLERVSIGGHTGGSVDYWFQRSLQDGFIFRDGFRRHSLSLGLFTSGLSLHIYF